MSAEPPTPLALGERLLVLGAPDAAERLAAATASYRASLRPPRPGAPGLRVRGSGDIQPLLDGVLGANHLVATRVSPDSLTAWHAHDCDQVLIVVEGTATVESATGAHVLPAGMVVFLPAGLVHRHGAAGDQPAETVYLTATGHDTTLVDDPARAHAGLPAAPDQS